MNLTRREFMVKGTALLATLGLGGPMLLSGQGMPLYAMGADEDVDAPVLVIIQLSGGNDGLNTIIPYGVGGYYDARPTLNILQKDVLQLNDQVGLHPSLVGMHDLFNRGKLAVIQGVGYPKPDHSHFRSMEIWQTATPQKYSRSGWLARYAESSLLNIKNNPLSVLQIGNSENKAFGSTTLTVPVIQSLETFTMWDPKTPMQDKNRIASSFQQMYDPKNQAAQLKVTCQHGLDAYKSVEAIQSLSANYQNKVEYPKTGIAKDLQLVSKMLAGKSGTRVFYLQLGGFDDHAQEKDHHSRLLKDFDLAVSAFYKDLEEQGLQNKVVTMAFSEFGRRVKENGNGGTDHGTAGPVVVFGGKVKGGLLGAAPDLLNLDKGDLKYEVDFRSIYYTMVENWLKGDGKAVVGKSFEKLAFI